MLPLRRSFIERLSFTVSIHPLQIATQPSTVAALCSRGAEVLLQQATQEAAAKFDRFKVVFQKVDEPQGQHASGEPNRILNAGDGRPLSHARIDLPELQGKVDQQIDAGNILALQSIHLGEIIEQSPLPKVADRLVELFQNGLLPIATQGSGSVALRNSFFTGRLLAANDFEAEQPYRRKD